MRLLILISLVLSLPAFAIKEYYSLSRGVRALSMGNAFYCLSDDEYALFYNPAGLALNRSGGQLMLVDVQTEISGGGFSSINLVNDAFTESSDVSAIVRHISSLSGNPISIGVTLLPFYSRKGFALGILFGDVKGSLTLLGSGVHSELDVTAISDSGLLLGKSFSFNKYFHAGVTSKFLFRVGGHKLMTLLDFTRQSALRIEDLGGMGAGFDFDLGLMLEVPKPFMGNTMGFSLSLNNLLASSFPLLRRDTSPPQLSRMVSAGTYVVFKGGKVIEAVVARLDFSEFGIGGQSDPDLGARTGQVWKHLNLGLELPMKGWLFIRSGLHQGLFTAGLGISLPFMKLELATYGEELGVGVGRINSRRYILNLSLGYASSPRHSYTARNN